ncbi:MAG: Rieske 2Fe-2S domain-containing protein [Planctomycetota bacterium]|nr:Rieske 2Fe-2S domain-containing protein [Planctomycetota bacterium]
MDNEKNTAADGVDASADSGEPRRNFMTSCVAGVIGAVVGIIPTITGLLFFLDPLIKKKNSGAAVDGGVEKDAEGRTKVANIADLSEVPERITVYNDKEDAWNMFLKQQVGAIYLSKNEGGKVSCFNVRCPHLGCSVEFRESQKDYYCPCHLSSFALDGSKQNKIPPRSLDDLGFVVDDDGDIWVKFQNYKATEATRIPVG